MKQLETNFDLFFQTVSHILMSFIKHLAKFIVPIPPSFYWSKVVGESSGSLIVGIFAGIVLEIGGMLAAHFAIVFYGTTKGKIAAVLTGLYLLIGIGVMWLIEAATTDAKLIITAIFIIAGMVYTLSAMYEVESQEIEQVKDDKQWEREQEAKDRELNRQLRIADKKLKHEERLAKIQAPAKQQEMRQLGGNLPTDWRQLTSHQKGNLAHSTREERENMFPELADRTRREWHSRLDKIAAQNGKM